MPDPGALQLETQNRRLPRWFWRLNPGAVQGETTSHAVPDPGALQGETTSHAAPDPGALQGETTSHRAPDPGALRLETRKKSVCLFQHLVTADVVP